MSKRRGREGGPEGAAAFEEIEARLAGLFGGFGKTLGAALEAARRGAPAGGERIFDETVDTGDGPVRMRAGMSVRFGGLGAEAGAERDVAEPTRRRGPDAPRVRVPLLDIYEEETEWRLMAELPGVAEAELEVAIEGGRLTLRTTGARRFEASAELPAGLDAAGMTRSFVNGILDLRIPRAGGGA